MMTPIAALSNELKCAKSITNLPDAAVLRTPCADCDSMLYSWFPANFKSDLRSDRRQHTQSMMACVAVSC